MIMMAKIDENPWLPFSKLNSFSCITAKYENGMYDTHMIKSK